MIEERTQGLQKAADQDTSHPAPRSQKVIEDMKMPRHPGTTLDEFMPILASSTANLRQAAANAFQEASDWLNTVNHSRWSKPRDPVQQFVRENNLAKLQAVLTEFRETKHFDLLEPFREAFDSSGHLKPEYATMLRISSRDMFPCYVFTTSLIAFALSLVDFLSFLLEVEKANSHSRIQLPTEFTKKLMESANEKGAGGNPLDMGANHLQSSDSESMETLVEETDQKAKPKKVRTHGTAEWSSDCADVLSQGPRCW